MTHSSKPIRGHGTPFQKTWRNSACIEGHFLDVHQYVLCQLELCCIISSGIIPVFIFKWYKNVILWYDCYSNSMSLCSLVHTTIKWAQACLRGSQQLVMCDSNVNKRLRAWLKRSSAGLEITGNAKSGWKLLMWLKNSTAELCSSWWASRSSYFSHC